MPVTPTTGTVYRNDHLHIDDAQVHPPKGYPTAGEDTYLTKSIHGENIWDSIMFQKPVIGFVTLGSSVSASDGDRYIVLGSSADGSYGDATPNSIVGYLTLDAQGNAYDAWDYRDAETGMLTYVSSDDTYYYFNGSAWVNLATGIGGGYWTQDAISLYPTDLTKNVGIGTGSPSYTLDVLGNFNVGKTSPNGVYSAGFSIDADNMGGATITTATTNTSTSESTQFQESTTEIGLDWGDGVSATNKIRVNSSGVIINSDTSDGNVGIGIATPTSKLEVAQGDIEVTDIGDGIIIKSPDATRWRITVSDLGVVTATAV